MTPEDQQKKTELEQEIAQEFSQLQQDLGLIKSSISLETDETKKQEKTEKIKPIEQELSDIGASKARFESMTSLHEEEMKLLKARLEALKGTIQSIRTEIVDLRNEKRETPTTYKLLKNSGTCIRLKAIITVYPDKFKKVPGENAEKKLEYIFSKIRENLKLFLNNKLGKSEDVEKVITNTIAPAFERSFMEMLRDQGNETNVGMLQQIDKISWESFQNLLSGVGNFAKKTTGSYNKFSQWMNAVDYLSVHNGVLSEPSKSEVLSNPLKFKEYMNDSRFKAPGFSPYTAISGNIFKVDENQTFEFGMSLHEKQTVLSEIGNVQVASNPKTTSLIVKLLDKPEKFFKAASGFQNTANHLLDVVESLNPITQIFGVDILGEITKPPENRSFGYKIMDFVCKLIGITGGLEGIVKKWRMDRMNLTKEKNRNISQIFEKYQEYAGENESLSITDENSCKIALEKFAVTENQPSTTKGDFLRDSIAENMDISLLSPAIIQQTLGDSYIKKQTNTENGVTTYTVDTEKINDGNKNQLAMQLAHNHLKNMKAHLEEYDRNDLSDFYTNIKSTEDLALCITASLYVDKNDVIEGVKAKVFLPENYGSFQPDGTVETNGNEQGQTSGEVSQYQLSPGEYPFKDVPPYKGIAAYDLRNVKMTPLLDYRDLVKGHEGSVRLSGSNITNKGNEYPSNGTTGNKNNNPCDISHSNSDIGYLSYSTVADGQKLAKYDTPANGIASAMRLLKNKYKNKSVTEINVGGYQGYYKPDEEIGLSALRIKWITDQCNALGIGPHQMLDFDDPTTLKSFVAQIAVLETGTHIGQQLLDEAYNLAFA